MKRTVENKQTRRNAPGWLITFEGGEGGGKSTQITRLRARLIKAGFQVIALREPGGTVISEQIRTVVLSSKNTGMAFTTEVLLFQAARAQIYREIVLPSLIAGKVVLMDRSRDSSVVYQGMVRGFGLDLIEKLNNISTQDTYPNLTFLLDLEAKLGLLRRQQSEEINRLDQESLQFHKHVRRAYQQLVQTDKMDRWELIDASQSQRQVELAIWRIIQDRLFIK